MDSNLTIPTDKLVVLLAACLAVLGSGIALSNELFGAGFGYALISLGLFGVYFNIRYSLSISLLALSCLGGSVTTEATLYKAWDSFAPLLLVICTAFMCQNSRRLHILVPSIMLLSAFLVGPQDVTYKINFTGIIARYLLIVYLILGVLSNRHERKFLLYFVYVIVVLALVELMTAVNVFKFVRSTTSAGPVVNNLIVLERPGSIWGDVNSAAVHFIFFGILLQVQNIYIGRPSSRQTLAHLPPVPRRRGLVALLYVLSILSAKSAAACVFILLVAAKCLKSKGPLFVTPKIFFLMLLVSIVFGWLIFLEVFETYWLSFSRDIDLTIAISMSVRLLSKACFLQYSNPSELSFWLGSVDYLDACIDNLKSGFNLASAEDVKVAMLLEGIARDFEFSPHNLTQFILLNHGLIGILLFFGPFVFAALKVRPNTYSFLLGCFAILTYFLYHNGVGSYSISLLLVAIIQSSNGGRGGNILNENRQVIGRT